MSGGVPAGELLPCPFCGQEGKALVGPIRDGAAVCCSNFKCLGQVQAFNPNASEKAITAWNTRATPAPPIEGRDADVERELRVAKAIARANGDEFANAFANKTRWIAKRGMSGGRFRDVNEPFQSDYLAMARAALQALGERG